MRAQQYAASIKAVILETSAKDNLGVSDLFHRVAEKVIDARGDQLYVGTAQGLKISPAANGESGVEGARRIGSWCAARGT